MATVAGQIAEAVTKAWNSAVGVKTVVRDLRLLHGHADDQPVVATVDLSKLDIKQDGESTVTATGDLNRLETDDESPSA